MKINYTLTMADYKAALRLHRSQKFSRRLNRFIYPFLAILLLFITLCLKSGTEVFGEFFALGQFCLLMSIGKPIERYFNRRKCFKRIFLSAQEDRNISIDINNDCVLSEIPGVVAEKYFWNTIVAFVQNEKITMLYVYEDRFLFFPTAVLSSVERIELNDLIARNMVRKRK
jgi:hypothetical protein